MFGMKRRKIIRERHDAARERLTATRDFVTAVKEVEAAMEGLRAANDKFYRSNVGAEQAALDSLRRARELGFVTHATAQLVADAPHFARLLGLRVWQRPGEGLEAWIQGANATDLVTYGVADQSDIERSPA